MYWNVYRELQFGEKVLVLRVSRPVRY